MKENSQHPRVGRHIIANGVRLHYVKIGTGLPPLIIIPGITSPAATWEFVGHELCNHFEVYILDVRGRGLSERHPVLNYHLNDYAQDLFDFIQKLGLSSPTILGHSMGARIAIRYAAAHPDPAQKIVLVDPPVSGPGRRPYPIPLNYYLESLEEVNSGQGFAKIKSTFGWTDAQINDRLEWLPTCDRQAITQSHESFHTEDIHQDLPKISAQVLLLYAEHGDTVRDAEAIELDSLLSQVTTKKVFSSGHMIPWDQLGTFIWELNAFLTPAIQSESPYRYG